MKNYKFFFFVILLSGMFSCGRNEKKTVFPEVNAVIDSVQMRYVPDRRDDVYDITVSQHNGNPVVRGATSVSEAKADLLNRIRKIFPEVIDSVKILPDENLEGRIYAVANVSVADLRTAPGYAAEMATQILLGMPMQLLQTRQGWFRVKTQDGYVAWIQRSTITRMNLETFDQWKSAPKVIFTDDYGFSYETPDEHRQRASDLVFGCLLKCEGEHGRFYRVAYPDGRQAFVLKSQSRMFNDWKTSIRLTEESIVHEALKMKGIPYSWGGTSVKAMDCSGYSKTVFLKHGVVLKRDASQQAKTGIPVDISAGYDQLRAGDLMFFGKKAENGQRERIRHVGIYLGNKEFIHAAGFVHINSLDPEQPHYDEGNTKEFVHVSRILGAIGSEGVWEFN